MHKKHQARQNQPEKSHLYHVEEQTTLLPFLLKVMSNRSRNSVKSILTRGQVAVDGEAVTAHNHSLKAGQKVTILKNKTAARESKLTGFTILYEDKAIIVINKDAGLLSIATAKEKEMTAYHQLMTHVRREHSRNRIFIVHRLDRDTSGVMLFAKSERVQQILQQSWTAMVQERAYVALVEGVVKKEAGTISSWLKETNTHKMYSSSKPNDGQYAVTHYKKMQTNQHVSLLEVHLETGRKNQIRVHMQEMGHPIVGDKKYGSSTNPIRRLGLHANTLAFTHPTTGEPMRFKTGTPQAFLAKSN